jgi:uncharacterized protein (TIGR02996 family)
MTEHEEHEKAAFFAMIRADPKNNDTRLVFADWCEEHGETELAAMLRGGSEIWLRNFAEELNHANAEDPPSPWYDPPGDLTYENLLKAVHAYLDTGKKVSLGMSASNVQWKHEKEFWNHFKVMTGRAVSDSEEEAAFACHC